MNDLEKLAGLIRERSAIDKQIAALLGRPAERGHAGEYIAAAIFDIKLEQSASHKGSDGVFASGPLVGRNVNVKWYARQESLLDINQDGVPDYYLVLTGPLGVGGKSLGVVNPWVIEHVYLFSGDDLFAQLSLLGVKIGIATSVRKILWHDAEIYPNQQNPLLPLSEEQHQQLHLFAIESII